jgi:cytidine deaminase
MNNRMITQEDNKLIRKAKALVGTRKIRGGMIKEVGCVLVTENGKIFSGVSMDLVCGIGFCAEHTAISQMITQTDETHIRTIVAVSDNGVIPPCGRCRELMNILDTRNKETEVIISDEKKIRLTDLLPFAWEVD